MRGLYDRNSPWTDERRAIVKRQWIEGKSASEIARHVAGPTFRPTRNAVIGIVHRMGLTGHADRPGAVRAAPSAPKVRRQGGLAAVNAIRKVERTKRDKERCPDPTAGLRKPALTCKPISLLALKSTSCRYPVAGEGAETLFCGAGTLSTYCPAHKAICWVGLPKRRADTPDWVKRRRPAA